MVLTLAAVAALICAMALTALDSNHVPPRLHALQRRMQAHMAPEWVTNTASAKQPLQEDGLSIFDELVLAEHEHEFGAEPAAEASSASAPTLTGSDLPAAETLLFLRAEIAVQLGFDLNIRGTTVNLTRRQYNRLTEYAAFAFDAVETPEAFLGHYGITKLHLLTHRRRRGPRRLGAI